MEESPWKRYFPISAIYYQIFNKAKGMEVRAGILVSSKAGHDKGLVYIVKEVVDEKYILVVGNNHSLEKPKKKNKKHIQPIDLEYTELIKESNCIDSRLTDENIKFALKRYKLERQLERR